MAKKKESLPPPSVIATDEEHRKVRAWLTGIDRSNELAWAIRRAIDWVIDGPRTGRYSIEQLQPSEKVYIGNRVEHEAIHALGLIKTPPLDTVIEGVAVDFKFSLKTSWMIPPEAIDKLCVITTANDRDSSFGVGLIRARRCHLGDGEGNRDGKRSISASGRKSIDWLWNNAPLPKNFLLHMDPDLRSTILALPSGQQRVIAAFRHLTGHIISTNALDTLAVQRDPSKRIRDARKVLNKEGIDVLGERYDKAKIAANGLTPLPRDSWLSFRRLT